MYRTATRHAPRILASLRTLADTADAVHRLRRRLEPMGDDEAGPALIVDCYSGMARRASVPVDFDEDAVLAARAARIEELGSHTLVSEYGFEASALAPFGFEVLAVVTEACRAARTLGRREASRVLGVENKGQSLASIDISVLEEYAADLQAAAARPVPAPAPAPRRGGIAPRASVAPPPPAAPSTAAASSPALLARIEAAKQDAARLKSPGAAKLLDRALVYRSKDRAEELVEQAERMLVACEAVAARHPSRPSAPRAGAPGGVRRPGKTARDRAKTRG